MVKDTIHWLNRKAALMANGRCPYLALVRARRLETTEADMLRCYPNLRAEDLANAWAYYRAHKDEIDHQIEENEAA